VSGLLLSRKKKKKKKGRPRKERDKPDESRERLLPTVERNDTAVTSPNTVNSESAKEIQPGVQLGTPNSPRLDRPIVFKSLTELKRQKRETRERIEDLCKREWNEKKAAFITAGKFSFTFVEGEPSDIQRKECRIAVSSIINFVMNLDQAHFGMRIGEYFVELMLISQNVGENIVRTLCERDNKNNRRGWYTFLLFLDD
jgi:hypothetical protein